MNLAKKKTVVYRSELYCKCMVCKLWDGENEGEWACAKLECACEEKVCLVAKCMHPDSNEMMLTYECSSNQCGFKIAAHDENCRAYVSIVELIARIYSGTRAISVTATSTQDLPWNV
jgi:hypothetical protein